MTQLADLEEGVQEMKRTNRQVAHPDLSRLVRDYYLNYFERRGRGAEFRPLVAAVWENLLEAKRYGADPGFLLHTLVCTKFLVVTLNAARSEALRNLTRQERAALVAGLRALRAFGEVGLREVFGPAEEWARAVWSGINFLYQRLMFGTVETPTFETVIRANPTKRQLERPLTTCILCLMRELHRHPKPAAATTALLEKFGLLRRSRGGIAAVGFVRKRFQRARAGGSVRPGSVGSWDRMLLQETYAGLKEFLMPPSPVIPARSNIWAVRAKAWGTTGPKFRGAFRRFCSLHGLGPSTTALAMFEGSLTPYRDMPKELRRIFTDSPERV